MYNIFYMYVNKKQAVFCLTAQKSPAKCILLLSPWVKTPPVWFVTSSKLYRQSNSYFCNVGPGILYYGTQSTRVQQRSHCWKYCFVVVVLLNSHFSPVHWPVSVRTGYVFCGTLVLGWVLLLKCPCMQLDWFNSIIQILHVLMGFSAVKNCEIRHIKWTFMKQNCAANSREYFQISTSLVVATLLNG